MNIIRSVLRDEATGAPAAGGAVAAPPPAAATPPPVSASPPPAGTTTPPAHWSSSWLRPDGTVDNTAYDRLPDNLKSLGPSLTNAKTVDDVFAKLHSLTTMAGKKALAPLPADAPPEAIKERNDLMRVINGVPEKPEGYGITKPADLPDFAWNQKATDALLAVAHKYNVSPAAVKEWASTQESAVKEQMATLQADEAKHWQEQDRLFKDTLAKDGIPMDKATDMVNRAAKNFGIAEDSPLLKYADVRLILQRAAVATMEPRTVTGQSPAQAGGQDFAKMAEDVIHNKNNPDHDAYWNRGPKNGNHPQNEAVKQKVILWQAEAARIAKQAQSSGGVRR